MRLCDRDIIQWMDDGKLVISPRPPVERINGATADVRLGNQFRVFEDTRLHLLTLVALKMRLMPH